jgi:hypothetical protein
MTNDPFGEGIDEGHCFAVTEEKLNKNICVEKD